jgi:hypothetical protein
MREVYDRNAKKSEFSLTWGRRSIGLTKARRKCALIAPAISDDDFSGRCREFKDARLGRCPAGEGGVEEAAKQRLEGRKGKKTGFRIGRSERDAIAG